MFKKNYIYNLFIRTDYIIDLEQIEWEVIGKQQYYKDNLKRILIS